MTLLELRKAKGLSQKQLAKMTGLHEATIVRMEQRGLTHLPTAVKLCKFYKVPLSELPLQ